MTNESHETQLTQLMMSIVTIDELPTDVGQHVRQVRDQFNKVINSFSTQSLIRLVNHYLFKCLFVGFIDKEYVIETLADENVFI